MIKKYFSKTNSALIVLVVVLFSCASKQQNSDLSSASAWKNMRNSIKAITAPVFINKVYNITNFGAQQGGVLDNTEAFKKAIHACSENGGR